MINKIIQLIENYGEASVNQIIKELGVSRQYVHRVLAKLVAAGKLERIGVAPRTFYRLNTQPVITAIDVNITPSERQFLKDYFLLVTETGKRLEGVTAMQFWCERQHLPVEKTTHEFIQTKKKYFAFIGDNGLISGLQKIRSTKGLYEIGLDALYYQDFYAIERFGKTKLGTLLHFAKQGQDRNLTHEIVSFIKPYVNDLIRQLHIDVIGYIPPTIKREVQFMQTLEEGLALPLPVLRIVKIRGEIVVPQKALSKLEERVQNARSSFSIVDDRKFHRLLLIDDAVGSGATINEMALKAKRKGIASYVAGYVITGSYKGFEVIQEV